jgi:hypothetical protein
LLLRAGRDEEETLHDADCQVYKSGDGSVIDSTPGSRLSDIQPSI